MFVFKYFIHIRFRSSFNETAFILSFDVETLFFFMEQREIILFYFFINRNFAFNDSCRDIVVVLVFSDGEGIFNGIDRFLSHNSFAYNVKQFTFCVSKWITKLS